MIHGNCNEGTVHRSEKYDAYYCTKCGWIESKCGDDECEFCKNRPDKPNLKEKQDDNQE